MARNYKTVPSAPQNLTATADGTNVELDWVAPADDGEHSINDYNDYEVRTDTRWVPISEYARRNHKKRNGKIMVDKNKRAFGQKNPSYPHFISARDLIEGELLKNGESWDDVVQVEHTSNHLAFKRFDDYRDEDWLNFLFYDEPLNGTSHMMPAFSVRTHDHQYISSGSGEIVVM